MQHTTQQKRQAIKGAIWELNQTFEKLSVKSVFEFLNGEILFNDLPLILEILQECYSSGSFLKTPNCNKENGYFEIVKINKISNVKKLVRIC